MNDYNELLDLRHKLLGKKSKYEEDDNKENLTTYELIDLLTSKAKELDSYHEALKYYMNNMILNEENIELLKETTFTRCLYDELRKKGYFHNTNKEDLF